MQVSIIYLEKLFLALLPAVAVSQFIGIQESQAVGVIDSFNSCTPGVVDLVPAGVTGSTACEFAWGAPGTPGVYDNTATAASGDIVQNVSRNIRLESFTEGITGAPPRGSYDIDFFGGSNLLSLNNNFGRSTLSITYSGLSTNLSTLGGGPANGRFNFNVLSNDSTSAFPINFTLALTQGATTYTSLVPLINSGAQSVLFDFSSPAFTGLNFNSPVSQIVFTVATTDQRDISIDSVGVEPVPFEYSQELGLVGVAGLFGAYKLKQRSKSKLTNKVEVDS
jgi:hypothetical protein